MRGSDVHSNNATYKDDDGNKITFKFFAIV